MNPNSTSYTTIDVHTHILPCEIPDWDTKFGYQGFVRLEKIETNDEFECTTDKNMIKGGKFFRRVNCNCIDPTTRMNEMKESGITMQVISTVPIMFNYWAKPEHCLETSQYFNNHIASVCVENPTKFIGLGTIPMQDTDLACAELRRCVMELKLKGVEIGTNINGKNLDDPMFDVFWKTVEELNAVVFVHPWDMMGGERMEKHWLSWLVSMPAETTTAISCMIFGGIYKKYPNLKVYYAHGGGSFIGTFERIQRGYDCRPDLYPNKCDPKDYLKYINVDALTHDPDMLHLIVSKLGITNVMVGSDYPFPLGEPEDVGKTVRKYITKYKHDDDIYHKIMYENAYKFFDLDLNLNNKIDDNVDVKIDNEVDAKVNAKVNANDDVNNDANINDNVITKIKKSNQTPNVIVFDSSAFSSDPIYHSNQISVRDLVIILEAMCNAYYIDAKPIIDNTTYDKMVSVLKVRDSCNQFLIKV